MPAPAPSSAIVGQGQFRYRAVADWAQLPVGWSWGEAVGAATDSLGRVYVFNRGDHPLVVLDRDGRFLNAWGEGAFTRPHGICIAPDDSLWLTDDMGHCVRHYSPAGELLGTLGTAGEPSPTQVQGFDYRTIQQSAGPFHLPTNVALAADGSLYVTDGYGNARVHKFSADGKLEFSWGAPGTAPGEFNVPHGIAIDGQGRVLVADRENSRVQFFSPQGEFLEAWTDVARPMEVFVDPAGRVFIVEVGWRAGRFPWQTPPTEPPRGARLSIFSPDHQLLASWGGGDDPCAAGDFFAPHDIWIDDRGDLYVCEVVQSAGGNRGLVSPACHTLQKFVRLSDA